MTGLRQWVARSQAARTFLPLVGYALFAVVWIGRGVVLHPRSNVLGDTDRDKTILMWSFSWWPHAIARGLDPFVAHVVWVPHGVDLAWVTSSPTLSLALAPVTETAGPVVAYNLAALAAPPLTAWTTYLLARRLTGSVSAALVGGFLFGFSPYLIAQSVGHLNLSFVCLVPLASLLAVRFFDGSLGRWRYTALLALVLALQFGISTEVFATLAVLAVICFVLGFLLLEARGKLAELARYTTLAYLAAGVVVTPYLVHAFGSGATPPVRPNAARHSLDLANLFFPSRATWLRPADSEAVLHQFAYRSGVKVAETGGYLGIPLLTMLVLGAVTLSGRARRGIWFLILGAVAAEAMAVGPMVRVGGDRIAPGVWELIQRLPALGEAIPVRLAMYAALFFALAAALWLAQPGGRGWRFALAGAAVLSFLPNPGAAVWTSQVPHAKLFDTSAYRAVIHPGDIALVFPYSSRRRSWSMLWQAQTGFRFSMIGGHIGQAIIPAECRWYDYYQSLAGADPPGGPAGFRRFLLAHNVSVIVEAPGTIYTARNLVAASLPDVPGDRVADATVRWLRPGLPYALPPNGPQFYPGRLPNERLRRAICGT